MKNTAMKKYIFGALLFAAALILVSLCACDANITLPISGGDDTPAETKTVRVVFAEDEGIEYSGERIQSVAQGSSASLSFKVKDGFTVERTEGCEISDDGTVTVATVYFPTTAVIKTRPLEYFDFQTAVSDFGDGVGDAAGSFTISADRCREFDSIVLTAVPSDDFAFVGFSEGAALNEGGRLISEEANTTIVPTSSALYYANFERAYATVKLQSAPGLIIKGSDSLRYAVGTRVFFSFGIEEGYVFDSADEELSIVNNTAYVLIEKPKTYSIKLTALKKYTVKLTSNIPEGGTVSVEPNKNYGWEGDSVTFKAATADSYVFNGFSEGKTLANGGKLLSTDLQYTCDLNRNLNIVANFELRTYTVKLKETGGINITSPKELVVPAGRSAQFTIEVLPGYALDNVIGAKYENGVITLDNVYADSEITIECHELTSLHFEFTVNNANWGSCTSNTKDGYYKYGTKVTLSATPGKGGFEGYKVNGKIVSTSTTYTLTITSDMKVEACFKQPADPALTITVPANKWLVLYHMNGGTGNAEGLDYYLDILASNTIYHCPNAMPNEGKFTRPGYVLIGYNTKEDGTGTFYAPGWNIIMPERGAISLWCVWEKETPATDFKYTVSSSTKTFQYAKARKITSKYVTITSYLGSDKTVVIPETINGYPVTNISAAAFSSNKTLETVVFSRFMYEIAATSFISCPNFTTVRITDSVVTMPNNWYTSCTNLQKMIISAGKYPTYPTGRNGTYAVKFDWLITAPGKKIVIVSGSNSAYGIDSPMLEGLLSDAGYKYSVVNYGQNASTAAAFYIEVSSHYMNAGDILIAEPEVNEYQIGYNNINATLWQIFEGAYDAFACVDTRHYVNLWSTFGAFNKTCSTRTNYSYETATTDTVNAWGDYSKNKVGATADWKTTLDSYDANGGKGTTTYSQGTKIITANASYSENGRTLKRTDEINRAYDLVTARGATVLYSFPAVVRTCLTVNSQTKGGTDQTGLIEAVDKYLHVTRISIPSDYIFERQYSYNSNWHLNTAGQQLRTQKLAADLIKYFKK